MSSLAIISSGYLQWQHVHLSIFPAILYSELWSLVNVSTMMHEIAWCWISDSPMHHYSDVIMVRDNISNHQPRDCFLNRLFRRRSKKHQSSASLAFVRGIHRWPVNSPHKWPVTRKMFPFDDVIMMTQFTYNDIKSPCQYNPTSQQNSADSMPNFTLSHWNTKQYKKYFPYFHIYWIHHHT